MCGIWATFGKVSSEDSCKSALKTLQARGPEGSRHIVLDGVGIIGFTRLAINGLSDAGMQPMQLGKITWVVNGEIYNWRALNEEYQLGCSTGSDCEVVGAMYKRFRHTNLADMFRLFDGVFACIIVDEELGQIVVARDPYGVRPLYKGVSNYSEPQLYFGSELKTILKDTTAAAFPPGRFEVYYLESQSYCKQAMTLKHGEAYHSLSLMKIPAFSEVETAAAAVRYALEAAVKKRMMTERPVACLLSGGLDSSLIASLGSKELRKVGAPP
jgi:asparagine synthase (glutamine-hydrolysing)